MKTKKIKKVLIALDYNPTAVKVAEVGFSMAKSMSAEVILLHVITDPVFYSAAGYSPIMGFTGYDYIPDINSDVTKGLNNASIEFLKKSRTHLGDKSIEIIVKEGDFTDSTLRAAQENNADIIVIGSHSQKWLDNIVLNSMAEKLLHKTTIPLFIVPTKKAD
jgi:nucleotide-binding universal stress UspA family protein